jgi:peptidoglycan hydrolase-like protein with peptidoglycan-binding domain
MNKIIFPLSPGDRGAVVANLHNALAFLLNKNYFRIPDPDKRTYLEGLQSEVTKKMYGDITQKLVSLFPRSHNIHPDGIISEETANAFNEVLKEMGALARNRSQCSS